MTTTTAETKAEKKEPRDGDRERILARARLAHDVLADLEEAALAASSRHDHQVDLLKAELAEANRRMTINLDDIRALLAKLGQDNPAVGALLVSDSDDEVQVGVSIHALVDTVAQQAGLIVDLQQSRDRAKADLTAAIQAARDNVDAKADSDAEDWASVTTHVRLLAEAIRPINSGAAEVAARADALAAIDVIAQAITELAGQLLTGEGNTLMKGLVAARESFAGLFAINEGIVKVCEAAGMPFCEPEQVAGWLVNNLKPRAKAPKAKAAAPEQEGPFVIMRNDANGRRFWAYDVTRKSDSRHVGEGPGWDLLPHAVQYDTFEVATTTKPRGSKVVTLAEATALVENDARIAAASAELPMASEGGTE